MQIEIGSNFWLTPDEAQLNNSFSEKYSPAELGFKGSDYIWLSTGRSATALVIKEIERRNPNVRKTVCLPPFTCHTVFEPFLNAGYKVVNFTIDKNLRTSGEEILKTATDNGAGIVLFHRYFGFDTLPGVEKAVRTLREQGIATIEDSTQCLYSSFDPADTDYHVASIRKWCGVPDGGFAVCSTGQFDGEPDRADNGLGEAKVNASLLKYNWIINGLGDKETFLTAYRESENLLNTQEKFYAIHPLSLQLQSRLDTHTLKSKRRQNFQVLLDGFSDCDDIKPVLRTLNERAVPLYFPIYCKNRKTTQQLLAQNNVFAPVVWPKDKKSPEVCSDADYIYDHILCIPIDQRYDADDMRRIISILINEL